MSAVLLWQAHDALAEDRGLRCQSCPTLIEAERDGQPYCRYCQSYWDDVRAGLFDDHSDLRSID